MKADIRMSLRELLDKENKNSYSVKYASITIDASPDTIHKLIEKLKELGWEVY